MRKQFTEQTPLSSKSQEKRNSQADLIAQCRETCCLDRNVPLGFNGESRPEIGPSVTAYFKSKHGPNGPGPGRFYPLHIVGI